MNIKSQTALDWMDAALLQVPASARLGIGSLDEPLKITFWIRYESRRPDLSVELILDMLQKARVIKDDRYVYEFHAYKAFSKDDPGADILIEKMG